MAGITGVSDIKPVDDAIKRRYELLFVVALFVVGTLIYFLLGNFDKAVSVYMDEMFYYDMARGLYNGNGYSINNFMFSFEKMSYPLLLMPFFSIADGVARVSAITLMNSVLMMSSVFPVWLIARELGISRTGRYIVLMITAVYPDMMFAVTFMAEVLYMPLTLWFVYFWLVNQKKPMLRWAAAMAVVAFATYMCKEIGAALVVGYVGFEIAYPFIAFLLTEKKERRRLHTYYNKKALASCAVFVLLFVAMFFAVKLLVFSGAKSNYGITKSTSLISDYYTWLYMLKAMLYYVAMLIVSMLFLPLCYPLIKLRTLDEGSRRLFFYTWIVNIVLIAAVIFTILIVESLGAPDIRTHLRYFGPQVLVLIIVFFRCLQTESDEKKDVPRNKTWIIVLAVLGFACVVFDGIHADCPVDQMSLNWYERLTDFAIYDMPELFARLYISVFMVSVILLLHYLYLNKSSRHATWMFAAVFLLVMLYGSYREYGQQKALNRVFQRDIQTVQAVNEYFSHLEDDRNIMYISAPGVLTKLRMCFDTYFDHDRDLYYVADSFAENAKAGDRMLFAELDMRYPHHLSSKPVRPVESFEYIILETDNVDFGELQPAGLELIPEISTDGFKVYRNPDIYGISFEPADVSGAEMQE